MLDNETYEDLNYIDSVRVRSFRSHDDLELFPGKSSVLIVGSNGVGKTSILEAISIFSYGKGIRDAKFYDMIKNDKDSFFVDICLNTDDDFRLDFSTSYNKLSKSRKLLINEKEITANYLRKNIPMLWIAPYNEKIFTGPSRLRRIFLDRLVTIFDNEHSTRLNEYEKNLRQRARILKEKSFDKSWIEVLEVQLSKLSVAICSSRLELLERLKEYLKKTIKYFPKIDLNFVDSIENRLDNEPAIDIEEDIAENYVRSREIDTLLGGSKVGSHKSNLIINNLDKNLLAELCSSGEQKSILISIVLSAAKAFKVYKKKSPIILLDEIFTHLDLDKKTELLNTLEELKSQIWITATEKEKFFQNNRNFCYHYLTRNGLKNAKY